MLMTFLASLYFSCLLSFSFVSHPVVYCVLLLIAAMCVSGMNYIALGFSWYLALFCLVYVGGVYVLFIFVSVCKPNPLPNVGSNKSLPVMLFFVFFCIFFSFFSPLPVMSESSFFLCSSMEGFSYCLFCLVLMVGFMSMSMVVGGKDSFFR